jgi:hypothetical protein
MEDATPRDSLHSIAPLPSEIDDGKDEMNFAEFPLAAIADRVPDDQKTLVFEDQLFDSGRSEMITRRLTIMASEKFGLPTSLDDEVILGLIQLSRKSRFADRKVNFSRYQLIQELGWRHEGRSYERLEKSLKRWLTVTLHYEKAWWDKEVQSWVDESFHILDNLTLYDQERRLRQLRSSSTEAALSSFSWNEVIYRSFKSGNLRTIDMRVFKQLEFAAAKRMYRFLDKRFYHKSRWEFDLTEFACEHIGVSRNYDTGQLKRRLLPAIAELEAVGFLEALPAAQRFVKISRGEWRIVFIRRAVPKIEPPSQDAALLIKRLSDRGVTPSVATELVQDYPRELIEMQMEVLDRLQQAKERESIRNPAGYLVKSIREGYLPPAKMMAQKPQAKRAVDPKPAVAEALDMGNQEIEAYLKSLSRQESDALEIEALARADRHLVEGYQRSKTAGGATFAVYRRMVLESEAKRLLAAKAETTQDAA